MVWIYCHSILILMYSFSHNIMIKSLNYVSHSCYSMISIIGPWITSYILKWFSIRELSSTSHRLLSCSSYLLMFSVAAILIYALLVLKLAETPAPAPAPGFSHSLYMASICSLHEIISLSHSKWESNFPSSVPIRHVWTRSALIIIVLRNCTISCHTTKDSLWSFLYCTII